MTMTENTDGLTRTDVQIEGRHAEFAVDVATRYHDFFDELQEIERTVNEVFAEPAADLRQRVCRHLAKMIANSFSSVVFLGSHGFGNDAMKIVRSMFEASITAAHLNRNPADVQEYFEYRWIVHHRRLEYMREFAPELLERLDPLTVERGEREYARVSSRFARRDGSIRPTWSRRPLSQLAAALGRSHEYDLLYAFGSDIQHAGIAAIAAQLDPDPEVLDVDIAPSDQWVRESFISAHAQTIITLDEYVDLAFPAKKPIISARFSSFEKIWKKPPRQIE